MATLTTVETSYGTGSRPLGPLTWAALRALDTSALRAGDFAEVSDLGYSHWLWTGTLWRPRAPVLLNASGVAIATPSNTAENVLATITVPTGATGLNGGVEVRTVWTMTNSANTKTPRVRLGGAAGTQYASPALTTTVAYSEIRRIRNRGAANSQLGSFAAGSTTGLGSSTAANVVSAVDMTAAADIVISGQKALGTETLTLESSEVWILP